MTRSRLKKFGEPDPSSEDTAMRSLTQEERKRLSIDSWEPSLLRHLLKAENRLPEKKNAGNGNQ